MRILKSHPILSLVNSYMVDSPQPANISYMWNFGSLLGLCLIIQILTGIFLAMHYSPNVDLAFASVEHIMRDVNYGWAVRYTHANTASFFFICVYLHIGRGLYYGSYRSPRILPWSIGVIILVLMMATAFLGYKHSPKWFNKNNYKYVRKYNKINTNFLFKTNIVTRRSYSTFAQAGKCNNQTEKLDKIIKELNLNYVYVYENLELEHTKNRINLETKGLSGIYMILNKITQDYYIGSASTNRIYSRFSNHLIYYRGSKIIKLAVQKYKLENFAFFILELYPNVVTKENNKELLDLEDKYLKLFLPNYNILTEAGSSFGYKHTEIDRQKMKDIYSEERRERIGNLNRSNKLSADTIEKIRAKALNRKPMSNEIKLKCISHTKPVILYNLNGTVYGKYSTILNAAHAIDCNEKTIRRALQTKNKLCGPGRQKQWIVKENVPADKF